MTKQRLVRLAPVFLLLFGASLSFARGPDRCVLPSATGATQQRAGPDVRRDVQEIQDSCDGLLVEQDSTRLKKEAWSSCCRGADGFVKKEPIPGHTKTDSASQSSWAGYRVRLALAACDGITSPDLGYERNLCLTEMLFRIPDTRVRAVLDECSPIGHHAGGKRHQGPPSDLLLGDESFSKCQHEKLKALLVLLSNGEATPPSKASSHRRNTSANPRSARTTE